MPKKQPEGNKFLFSFNPFLQVLFRKNAFNARFSVRFYADNADVARLGGILVKKYENYSVIALNFPSLIDLTSVLSFILRTSTSNFPTI